MIADIPSHVRPAPSEFQRSTVKTLRAAFPFGPPSDQIRRCKLHFHAFRLDSSGGAEFTSDERKSRVGASLRDPPATACDSFIFTRGASFGADCKSGPERRVCLLCASKGAHVVKPRSPGTSPRRTHVQGNTFSGPRSRGDLVVTRHELPKDEFNPWVLWVSLTFVFCEYAILVPAYLCKRNVSASRTKRLRLAGASGLRRKP